MKKKLLVLFIAVVIIVIGVICVGNFGYIKTRLYSGDRITGTFVMTVDGKEYNPVEESLEYENSGKQRLASDGLSSFSIKGGEYGCYKIGFLLDNEELYKLTGDESFQSYETNQWLIFEYINTNWWHITKMTLSAEMVLKDGEWIIYTKVIYAEKRENGDDSEYKPIEESFSYSEIMSGDGIIHFGV